VSVVWRWVDAESGMVLWEKERGKPKTVPAESLGRVYGRRGRGCIRSPIDLCPAAMS
jgi:hypothetical protein